MRFRTPPLSFLLLLPLAVGCRNNRGDVLEAEVGFYGVEFYGAGDRRLESSENEDLFFQHMEVYNSYWREDPQFDTTNTQFAAPHLPCPLVDRTMLRHLTRIAIANKFSWKDPVVESMPATAGV